MHPRFLFFALLFITETTSAQSPWVKIWDKRFGGTTTDIMTSASATSDGGLLMGGHSWSPANGDKSDSNCSVGGSAADYWIIKTDSMGVKLWDGTYGGNSSEELTQMLELPSHNIIIAGYSISDSSCEKTFHSWGNNSYDYWILLIDSIGNKIWDHAYGGDRDDKLQSIKNTADGGLILGGWSSSDSSGDKSQNSWHNQQNIGTLDYWIVKTDTSGNKLWDRTYGGTATDGLTCLDITDDGGFILGGYSMSGISGDKSEASFDTAITANNMADYWIIKTDSMGIKQWDRTYGGLNVDRLFSIHQLPDGGYILGGYSESGIGGNKTQPGNGGFDYWIIRTDSLGNMLWDRSLGGSNNDNQWNYWATVNSGFLIEDRDGGFIMSGASESPISGDKTENNLGPRQIWMVKVDSLGNKVWDKTIFTNATEDNGILISKGDSCFVVATATEAGIGGYKTEPSQGLTDYWSVVFCQPMIYTGIPAPAIVAQPALYPNPCFDALHISIPEGYGEKVNVTVYDITGRNVRFLEINGSREGSIPDFGNLSNGIYMVEIVSGTNLSIQRVVKGN